MGIFGSNQPGQARYSGRLHDLQLTQSVFGTTVPILFGTDRLAAKLLFYGGFYAKSAPSAGGKGLFGGKNPQYDYFADMIALLCAGSAGGGCRGILSVWDQQGKLQNQGSSVPFAIPTGGGMVQPQTGGAAIQQDLGVSKTASYSVVANDYGSGGSRTLTGTQNVPMVKVTGTPGAGQYAFDAATSAYTFSAADAGAAVTISYSTVFSLYYRQATQAAQVPLSSPYQISTTNQSYFYSNQGVVRVDTGATLAAGSDYTEGGGVYTFSSALAGVYVYIKYTFVSNDSNLTNSSHLNLTFFGGTLGQAPWSYMQSKYPGSAFGHTGKCYIGANPMALGTSASLPSYNYEVAGLNIFPGGGLDAHPCDALRTLLYDGLLGVGFPAANVDIWTDCFAYWAANGYLIKKRLDTQTAISEAFSEVIKVGNAAAVWSGGLLKLIPYGDSTCVGNGYTYSPPAAPAATLTWDDLLAPSDLEPGTETQEDVLQVTRKAPQDAWNYMQAQYTDRANDYNIVLVNEQNDAFINEYGQRIESPQNWDWITSRDVASWALGLRLKRECYIVNTFKFWLSHRFSRLEPMDKVVLPTGEIVRITQVEDDANGKLAIEAEQWTYGASDASIYPKQAATSFQPVSSQELPGDTYPVIFEASPQSVLSRPNTLQLAVAGDQVSWGGCDVYVSSDGLTYSYVDRIKSLGRTGLLSAALPSASDPDTTNTMAVDLSLSGGSLVSVTAAQANSFASLSAIVDTSGSVELVSFETATLLAGSRYNLTYLRRGVYGTPIAAHAVGAWFAYIGVAGIFEFQYPAQYAGKTIYFKFASFNVAGNQLQDISTVQAYAFAVPGTTLQPPSGGAFTTNPANPLTAQASGTAGQISVSAFTARLNNQQASCTPASPITGLNQDQGFWVYYIDRAFAGGAVTPVATQNTADFLGKAGYYQLLGPNADGSITVPLAGGAGVYRPSSYSDKGSSSTASPSYAYDTSPITAAGIISSMSGTTEYDGDCVFQGMPAVTSAAATLTVIAQTTIAGTPGSPLMTLSASLDGGSTWTSLLSTTVTTASTSYTLAVPLGTHLDQVRVEATASTGGGASGSAVNIAIKDINIQ